MKCEAFREYLWESDEADLPDEQRVAFREHSETCHECADELAESRAIQSALRNPDGINAKSRAQSVLNSVYAQMKDEEVTVAPLWSWRPFAGFIAAAAVAIFAIVAFSPNETTALTIDKLTNQHRVCLIKGHQGNYRCNTEAAFAQLTLNELGFATRPFEVPADAFKKGDICKIGGKKVAHALLAINGATVSYFRLFGANINIQEAENWIQHSENIWWMKQRGHLVVLRKTDQNNFDFYTGKVTIADLEKVWEEGSR